MDIRWREGPFEKAQFERACGEGDIETIDRKDNEKQGAVRSSAASISKEGTTYRSADRVKGISKRYYCTQSLATVWSHYIPRSERSGGWQENIARTWWTWELQLQLLTEMQQKAGEWEEEISQPFSPILKLVPLAPTTWNRCVSVLYCAHRCMKCSLRISNFLEEISDLSHSIVFLYLFALITEEGFLISPCYTLEFCIQIGISFLFSFAFLFSSFLSYL